MGSVGMGSWIILLTGRDDSDLLILQVKQATTSVLSRFAGPSSYLSQGKRVVAGQQLMQATSDIFLGWHPAGKDRARGSATATSASCGTGSTRCRSRPCGRA